MSKPRNVLVLICDHHRFDALGCLGNPLARTPNLDRLAGRSVRFANCFNQSPVCSPARYSLATGQYAHAHGVITNQSAPTPGITTIGHALQPLGYRRFNLGHMHWQAGHTDTGYEPLISHNAWRDAMPAQAMQLYEWEAQAMTRRRTGGPSPRTREQYSGHFVAQNAIACMEEAVGNEEPFLCWAAFSEPHPPFYPPRDIYETYDQSTIQLPPQAPPGSAPPSPYILQKRREWEHLTDVELRQVIAGYYGMVELVDGYIGDVLAALERLGIADDTIVVWTVDHGDQMWEHEMFLKFCMYEASVHIPLLISVPGNAPGVREELVEHIDLFPTICELTGADTPGSVHGRPLSPLLDDGPAPDDWRDAVFSQIAHVRMVRTRDCKLNTYDHEPGEFYDLAGDPAEFDNRIAAPECREAVGVLSERLQAWELAFRPTAP